MPDDIFTPAPCAISGAGNRPSAGPDCGKAPPMATGFDASRAMLAGLPDMNRLHAMTQITRTEGFQVDAELRRGFGLTADEGRAPDARRSHHQPLKKGVDEDEGRWLADLFRGRTLRLTVSPDLEIIQPRQFRRRPPPAGAQIETGRNRPRSIGFSISPANGKFPSTIHCRLSRPLALRLVHRDQVC